MGLCVSKIKKVRWKHHHWNSADICERCGKERNPAMQNWGHKSKRS